MGLRCQHMFQRSAVAPVDHHLSHLAATLQANVDEASLCMRRGQLVELRDDEDIGPMARKQDREDDEDDLAKALHADPTSGSSRHFGQVLNFI